VGKKAVTSLVTPETIEKSIKHAPCHYVTISFFFFKERKK